MTKRRDDDDDDKNILKDGETRRITKMMKDGFDRQLMADGGTPSAHRPGWGNAAGRAFVRNAHDEATEAAYDEVAARDAAAWQGNDKEYYEPAKDGQVCTVSGTGQSGHVKGGKCIADSASDSEQLAADQAAFEPTGDVAFDSAMAEALVITDARERAYRLRELEDQNAWRNQKR